MLQADPSRKGMLRNNPPMAKHNDIETAVASISINNQEARYAEHIRFQQFSFR